MTYWSAGLALRTGFEESSAPRSWQMWHAVVSVLALLLLTGAFSAPAHAQSVTFAGNQIDFGSVNVCPSGQNSPAPCSQTLTLNYNVAATTTFGATPNVLTQGAPNLDFKLASGNTCTGTVFAGGTCEVNVTFAPLVPGGRMGAVQLTDSSNNLLVTTLIYGIGQGPAIAFGPGVQTTVSVNGLGYPGGIALDGAGDLFIVDGSNNRVLEVPPGGGTPAVVGSGLSGPTAVAVDGAGNIFIGDLNNNRVVEVPAGGGAQITVNTGNYTLSRPYGVAVDGAGNIFIADGGNNRVVEVPAGGGAPTTVGSSLSNPHAVAVDGTGNVFIGQAGPVAEVLAGGAGQTTVNTGSYTLAGPEGITVDGAGDVFITDTFNNRVVEVPAGGGTPTTVGSGLSFPFGVAVDGAGDVFITNYMNSQVVEVQRSRAPSLTFASTPVGSTSSDSPQSVTIQNIGNEPLNAIAPGLVVTGPNFLQVAGSGTPVDCNNSFELTPGATCNLSLNFRPQNVNPPPSTAVFTDNVLNISPSTSQTITMQVTGTPAGQTINFTLNAPASAVYGSSFTVAATGGASGNPVTFTFFGECSVVTNFPGNATYTMNSGTGACSVIANQAGNASYSAAPQIIEAVSAILALQTINFTTDSPTSAVYNSSFTVSATGGVSGNAVAFASSGACSNLGGTYTMTSGTGTCSVIANQAGNSNYSAASPVTQTVNAALAAQTIGFTANAPASAAYNSGFTVSASGGASGNAVAFTSSGACSNSGATYTMTSGTGACSVIANQAGNANYSAASPVTQTVNATLAAQTIGFTASAPASAAFNSSFTVSATGGGSGNAVTFTSSGACSNLVGTYTMTSGTGTCSVIANQAGNANYSAASPVTQTVNATLAAQTITFPAIPTQNGPGTVTLAATASSGLTVSYAVTSGPATVSGNIVTTTAGGAITVQASQAGNGNYSAATAVSKTFTVNANASGLNGNNCNGEYTGTYSGSLTVSKGQVCSFTSGGVTGQLTQTGGRVVFENNSFVNGNVQMSGGSLTFIDSSVGGNFGIQNLPASAGTTQVCGSSVKGNLQVQSNGAAVQIGSGTGCAGNTVGGDLQVHNNSAATTVDNNTVGGNLQNQNNTGATEVFTNVVTHQLQCNGNSSITGGGNTASSKTGQCATF